MIYHHLKMYRSDFNFPAKEIFHNLAQNVLIISKVFTSKTLANYFYIAKCLTPGEGPALCLHWAQTQQ